jgi:hypothetical protein
MNFLSVATLKNTVMTSCWGVGMREPNILYNIYCGYSNTWCDPYQSFVVHNIQINFQTMFIEKSVITTLAKLGIV